MPALALWLVQHQAWAAKAGTIVLCYAAGLLAGNLSLVSATALQVQKAVS